MAETSTAPEPEPAGRNCYYGDSNGSNSPQISRVWEIEEESELFEINHGRVAPSPMTSIKEEISLTEVGSMFSIDVNGVGGGGGVEDCVYVGVGKGDSSLDAVAWAVAESSSATTVVYLIHVFPEVHHIPSPLGKLPKSQVSKEQVENYMAQERGKRRELLEKFINKCSASKVKVETMLIESDLVGKAIVDLIPILNIRKLVLGSNKSNLKKLIKHRKGNNNNNSPNSIAGQVLQNSPDWCEISIISDGKRVINTTTLDQGGGSSSSAAGSSSSSPRPMGGSNLQMEEPPQVSQNGDSFACMCFRSPKVAM